MNPLRLITYEQLRWALFELLLLHLLLYYGQKFLFEISFFTLYDTAIITIRYPLLQKFFPGTSAVAIISRVFTDQLIGSPIVITLFFSVTLFIHNKTIPHYLEENLKQKIFTTWITGLQYWPIIHTVNFGFIPSPHQPLFAHVASVYWNAVLSYYAFRTLHKDK